MCCGEEEKAKPGRGEESGCGSEKEALNVILLEKVAISARKTCSGGIVVLQQEVERGSLVSYVN